MARWSSGDDAPAKASATGPSPDRTPGCRAATGSSSRAWAARSRRCRSAGRSARSPRRSRGSAARSPAGSAGRSGSRSLDDGRRNGRVLHVRPATGSRRRPTRSSRSVLSHWRMRDANTGSSRNSQASSRISSVGIPSKRSVEASEEVAQHGHHRRLALHRLLPSRSTGWRRRPGRS